ncbi:MAG: 2-dehydro-3-deoxygalactonokinase [Polaromonas sp.]|nr:2-dehydro-3-deoxygalactonokinase [Polaromonas sp.]
MPSPTTHLLAIDWGTSSLRGAQLAPDGAVLQERAFERGILTIRPGEFPVVFESCFGDWMAPGTLCLIAGMAGSQQGWLEAPYCPCPAGFADIAARLVWVDHAGPGRIAIVPGLNTESDGIPDVMRGEETQVFGALAQLGLLDALFVLPGTHSKWVTVKGSRIVQFSSWMTGEFYALLRWHSILARTLPLGATPHDDAAFKQGVTRALRGEGLLHTAFGTRTLALFTRMEPPALASYLSGLVIGEELRGQQLRAGSHVIVIGAPALAARYQQALDLLGVTCRTLDENATWAGLRAIADTLAPV